MAVSCWSCCGAYISVNSSSRKDRDEKTIIKMEDHFILFKQEFEFERMNWINKNKTRTELSSQILLGEKSPMGL